MNATLAGGRKTQNDAVRSALGNKVEERVEALLAAMTKGVEDSFARAVRSDWGETQREEAGVAARLTSACASLISAAARLHGQFRHDIRVVHVWEGSQEEEEEEDSTPPLFAPGEIKNYNDEELLQEIALRKARYEARKTADHLAQLEKTAEVPSASAISASVSDRAPEDAPSHTLDEVEAGVAALEEFGEDKDEGDGIDDDEFDDEDDD